MLYAWLNRVSVGILLYRLERGFYLILGKGWEVLRVLLSPLLNLFYAYSNCEIHYKATIGPGILILHASVGVVVSAKAIIGTNLTLTGGNTIGSRDGTMTGNLTIGDNCTLGVNAVVLGPITLGDDVKIGACALVIDSFGHNVSLGGVPAKLLSKATDA